MFNFNSFVGAISGVLDLSEAVLRVTRIQTTFTDNIGNKPKRGCGTAFWLRTPEGAFLLVTNRHNLDPQLLFGDPEGWELTKVEAELRWVEDEDSDNPTKGHVKFLEVPDHRQCLFKSQNDCAFLADPFGERPEKYAHQGMSHFHEEDLATEEDLPGFPRANRFLGLCRSFRCPPACSGCTRTRAI